MALIKMSNIGITAISGKAGGSVYSRNRGGEYFKNFVMPTNSFSDARQAVQAVFGSISKSWRALTQSKRDSWIEAAPKYLRTNAFGDLKQLSPNALYVAQNQNLAYADLPLINNIGAPEGTNGIVGVNTPFSVKTSPAGIQFNFSLMFDNSQLPSPNDYVLEATPSYGPGVKNVENLFKKLATTTKGVSTPSTNFVSRANYASGLAIFNQYAAKFGTPAVGSMVSIRIKAVNPSTGEVSTYWQSSAVVS